MLKSNITKNTKMLSARIAHDVFDEIEKRSKKGRTKFLNSFFRKHFNLPKK